MAENVFDGDASKYEDGDGMLDLSQERRAFVEEVAYYANQEYTRRREAGEDWVLPSVCVAQACLESGFGDATTVNIFGIKGEGTTAPTSEEYTPGVHTTISDSFVSHGTIEDDVKVYYDLICGTGDYEGWDIYSAARNNEDAADAVREIRNAGYATSSTYSSDVISILDQYNLRQFDTGSVNFEYNEAGYQDGVAIYEAAKKIIESMEQNIENSENTIKTACANKPQVDYNSIVKFSELKSTVQTIKELLEKTKMIADEEKYIAEQYNDDGGGSLSSFQAASMATQIKNFAFNDLSEFKKMVDTYQSTDSKEVFSKWFEGYVSTNGIESQVVNMSQYQLAIKETGAVASSDYVVSKASFILVEDKEEKKETDKTNTKTNNNDNNSENSGSQFRTNTGGSNYASTGASATGAVVSSGTVTSAIASQTPTTTPVTTPKTTPVTTPETKPTTQPTTTPTTQPATTPETQPPTTPQTSPTSQTQPSTAENTMQTQSSPSAPAQTPTTTSYQSSPASTASQQSFQPEEPAPPTENPTQPEPTEPEPTEPPTTPLIETPTTKPVTKIPTVTTTPNVNQTTQSSSGSTAGAALLGLGTAAAVGGGAAYYIHNKHKKAEMDEYDEGYEYEEDSYNVENDDDDEEEVKPIPEFQADINEDSY